MAINIDTVYQKVLALANKEQRGYVTPQEFNLFADQAQMEIFEQYFYDLNQYMRIHGNAEEYSDVIHNINEKIALFESTSSIGSGTIAATDLYRLGTVISNGIEVEEVQQNEILYMNNSAILRPSASRPVYVRTGETSILTYPSNIFASCTYVRKPTKPNWSYVVVNGSAMYDPSNKADFELHPSEENELIYKILKFAGLAMKRLQFSQMAAGLETLQVQQEKQ